MNYSNTAQRITMSESRFTVERKTDRCYFVRDGRTQMNVGVWPTMDEAQTQCDKLNAGQLPEVTDTPQIMEENGKRFRMLQIGETIDGGDEVQFCGAWHPCSGLSLDCVVSDPRNELGFPQGYYRRPILS